MTCESFSLCLDSVSKLYGNAPTSSKFKEDSRMAEDYFLKLKGYIMLFQYMPGGRSAEMHFSEWDVYISHQRWFENYSLRTNPPPVSSHLRFQVSATNNYPKDIFMKTWDLPEECCRPLATAATRNATPAIVSISTSIAAAASYVSSSHWCCVTACIAFLLDGTWCRRRYWRKFGCGQR